MNLKGKTALVTGAARGIGLACARELLKEGAQVALCDVDAAAGEAAMRELGGLSGQASFHRLDVCNEAEVAAAVDWLAGLGGIHVLVNNAAIVRKGSIVDISLADFDEVYRVNLRGYLTVAQAVARRMIKAGVRGSIINMSSVNGQVAIGDQFAYTVMKGGVNQMTRAMALGLAPYGIRVNAIAPGSINTELFKQVVKDEAARRTVLSRTPLGRPGEPSEIGRTCVFLAGDDSSYMTGEIVAVDGGRLALNYVVPVADA
jgi:NAD(P)-dependent dehydrogenase (short-subunit alcohol dehydrogenase family)